MIDSTAVDVVLQDILPAISSHRNKTSKPFILGLSGLQGSGKSTWAAALTNALNEQPNLHARTLSLDDLYLDHPQLVALRDSNPGNALLRTRGQPGTHDEVLARQFFQSLERHAEAGDISESQKSRDILWPAFDKSLNNGEGGRVAVSEWEVIPLDQPLHVLIFEGWCLGFQPLSPDAVEDKWRVARFARKNLSVEDSNRAVSTQTLGDHQLDHLLVINDNLARYCHSFMGPQMFDVFIHLDTEDLRTVYDWRLGQEAALWKSKGTGMTDKQVIDFVRGYMPAYELYLSRLSAGHFFTQTGNGGKDKIHIRIVLDKQRGVSAIEGV
ncbi:P-loop containing nucleoside triphosphate hydrolase protein [Sarocladium strictum]